MTDTHADCICNRNLSNEFGEHRLDCPTRARLMEDPSLVSGGFFETDAPYTVPTVTVTPHVCPPCPVCNSAFKY